MFKNNFKIEQLRDTLKVISNSHSAPNKVYTRAGLSRFLDSIFSASKSRINLEIHLSLVIYIEAFNKNYMDYIFLFSFLYPSIIYNT